MPQKQEHAECPLLLGQEGEKQEVDDSAKTRQSKRHKAKNKRKKQGKVQTAKITAGKG
jgi:hypothetical protein